MVGSALLDPERPAQATAHTIDDDSGLDSHPAVAWNGENYGAVWLNERRPPSLVFQALGGSGAPIGTVRVVDERMDESVMPRLEGTDGGFEATAAIRRQEKQFAGCCFCEDESSRIRPRQNSALCLESAGNTEFGSFRSVETAW